MIGKNIARYGASLTLSLCLLSGCASKTQWTKPRFNSDEFKQDYYLCDREANILASQQAGAMSSAVNPLFMYAVTKGTFFNNCMKARSYQQFKTDKERELIESSEKPLSPSIGDQGDRWKYIGSTGKMRGNHWFIDTQTISYLVKGDVIRIWAKTILDKEGKLLFHPTIKSPKNLGYVLTLLDIDCSKCAYKTLKLAFHRMDGVLIDSSDFLNEPWRPIDPGSMFIVVYKKICLEKEEFQTESHEKPKEKDSHSYALSKSLEQIESTWTEEQKYAFNLGRAASLGRVEATLKKMKGLEKRSRADRESEEVFTLYKNSPEKLEGLHLIYEGAYEESLTPDKVILPKKLEVITSNLSPFFFDLGWAYDAGVLHGSLDKTPESTMSERDKQYPFNLYQDDPKALEELHRAFEWGYTHGKTYPTRLQLLPAFPN
jgi:hypothetical protein